MTVRLGIDVGGTFTDFLVSGEADSFSWKTPTTYPDPSQGIFQGIQAMASAEVLDITAIDEVSVGTTIALNTILSRTGVPTAVLTTRGFRDVLEIGRESRRRLYDLQQEKPPLLVARRYRVEVDERIGWQGHVLRPLDLDDVRRRLDELLAAGIQSVAVCLLHAYANPRHELQIEELINNEYAGLTVTVSHKVLRRYREYERTLLTTLNAYVKPVMQSYVRGFVEGVRELSETAGVFIAHSAGGVMRPEVAGERAIHSALSGPAAGVRGAARICADAGISDFITMDMGGTSCDVAVIEAGEPRMTHQAMLGRYPIDLRTVDVASISAGGGTIAWVDPGGLLRVGPQSARSHPGPACYQRGGKEPTVTDAHVVLGHLDPARPLGGSIAISTTAARDAVKSRIAKRLGLDVETAAMGIVAIADAAMVRAIEEVSIERGHDPRDFVLCAFGGAAPLHAATVAAELGIARVIVPGDAGVLCALGTLCCDEQYEVQRPVLQALEEMDPRVLTGMLEDIGKEVLEFIDSRHETRVKRQFSLEMRYQGQTFSLEVPLTAARVDAADLARLHGEFECRYQAYFGYSIPGNQVEIESVRALLSRPRSVPTRTPLDAPRKEGRMRRWRAQFDATGFMDCLMVDADELVHDQVVEGPAVIAAANSTMLVPPGHAARRDSLGNVLIDVTPQVPAAGPPLTNAGGAS